MAKTAARASSSGRGACLYSGSASDTFPMSRSTPWGETGVRGQAGWKMAAVSSEHGAPLHYS